MWLEFTVFLCTILLLVWLFVCLWSLRTGDVHIQNKYLKNQYNQYNKLQVRTIQLYIFCFKDGPDLNISDVTSVWFVKLGISSNTENPHVEIWMQLRCCEYRTVFFPVKREASVIVTSSWSKRRVLNLLFWFSWLLEAQITPDELNRAILFLWTTKLCIV